MLSSMHIIKVNPLLDRYNKLGGPIWTCRPVREGKFKRSTTTDSYLFSQKKIYSLGTILRSGGLTI